MPVDLDFHSDHPPPKARTAPELVLGLVQVRDAENGDVDYSSG
jgi:hypothetical protein